MTTTKKSQNKLSVIEKNKSNLSFQKELEQTIKDIVEIKTMEEANIVSILWKNPKLVVDYCEEIHTEDFSNLIWGAFYEILYRLTVEEGRLTIDDATVGTYLSQHKKLLKTWTDAGGYNAIINAGTYVHEDNIESCIKNFHKWQKLLKLAQYGFPINTRLSEFKDKNIESIYNEYDIILNDIFANEDFDVKSYDMSDDIESLIDKLDKGNAVGLPFKNLPLFNEATNGMVLGGITLIGGISNSGKSSFLRATVIPSIIEKNERLVIFLNEEGIEKWQRELIIWVANNIFKKELTKSMLTKGHFTQETKDCIMEAAKWIENYKKSRAITFVPLEKYRTSTVVKLIKKYSSMGVKYFAIDTFKMDNADGYMVNDNARLQMVQNMTNLYNTVKDSCKNVHLLCTIQLNKGSLRTRYIGLDNIGESKNIVDVCSSAYFIRNINDDEKEDGRNALQVFRYGGANGKSLIPVTLDKDKNYQVIFISKSREGMAGVGSKQIVIETDYSKNIIKEIGYTYVPQDIGGIR